MAEQPPHDDSAPPTGTTRREVIRHAASLAGMATVGSVLPHRFTEAATTLPNPATSGIDHIVVLMMENRSFDHMLGWLPGANGVQAGRTFIDNAGQPQQSHLLTKFQNCSSADPDHSFQGGRTQLDGGAMDGFLKTANVGDTFPIGYYSAADVPFFAWAARYWTICDSYHCSMLGPTWPNRFYMHSGQTDRLTTGGPSFDTGTLLSVISPTIWDLAAAAGVSAKYYYSDEAFTALWGAKYAGISFLFSQFQLDAAAGNLPSISFIDPHFVGEAQGTSNDDHPLADIRNGQVLMNVVYQTLSSSPNWANTLLIINYDEWGGFADHVAPSLAPVSAHEVQVGNVDQVNPDGTGLAYLGFRTPCILIGPHARRGSIAGALYDANSILNLITWRFGLPNIGVRATTSANIAGALNLAGAPNATLPPPVNLVNQVYGEACALNPMADLEMIDRHYAEHFAELAKLDELMKQHGFRTV
jgi:phospholipase C